MPIYVYQCKNCGHAFEKRQSFSDNALRTCPSCGQETLRKRYNEVGVVFKGSGFYTNDKNSSTNSSSSSSGSSTGTASPPRTQPLIRSGCRSNVNNMAQCAVLGFYPPGCAGLR